MIEQANHADQAQPVPAAWWLVETRGPCGVLREVGRFADRESAADLAETLRERGLAVCIAWCRE